MGRHDSVGQEMRVKTLERGIQPLSGRSLRQCPPVVTVPNTDPAPHCCQGRGRAWETTNLAPRVPACLARRHGAARAKVSGAT